MTNGPADTSPIRIYLLGRFEVTRGEQQLRATDWKRRKAAALLQRLALERRLLKDQAIEFLWPDTDPEAGANNLYRTLYALRQTLTDGLGLETPEAVFSFTDGLLLLNDDVSVDVEEFRRLLAGPSPPSLQQALDLYRGDLLPDDLYSAWTQAPREGLRRARREASLTLAEQYRQLGQQGKAIALLTPLLADDPADEPVHRELMRLYALNGRRPEALRQYQSCVDALAAELDLSPTAETEALYTQIVNGDLPAARPSSPAAVPDNEPLTGQLPPAPIQIEVGGDTPFVGREAELDQVQAAMAAVGGGQGQTILLAGDTGVGKTRLAYEVLRLAADDEMVTLFGAAYEQEGQSPYQPFIEAFNRYLLGQKRPLTDNPITHFQPSATNDLQQEQWALFNNAATFLARLSQQAPVLLFIDDLHAADEASLRLFHYLARHTRHTPIVLLATYRTDLDLSANAPFEALLNALYRERLRTLIRLRSLPGEAVAAIVADIWQGEVEESLLQAIFAITEGNPFFTEEVTHALTRSDRVEQVAGRWRLKATADLHIPAGLGELLRQQVARLGTAVTTTLEAAAVIGRQFSFDLLQQVTPLTEWQLLDALETALTARLVAETETEDYRFRHGLIRHVLYEAQSRARRTRLHTLAGRALEEEWQQSQEPGRLLESLVYHFERSQKRERALPYLLQAGQHAAELFAFEVAVNDFERALALMDEVGLDDPARRWKIQELLGWWYKILANTPRSVTHFEQALDLPPTPDWQPARQDRVRAHCGAAMTLLTAGETAAAESHLEAALAQVDPDKDASEFADVLYNMAQVRWHRNEYQAAFDLAQRSLAIAERLNKPEAIARAFEMLALACHSLGEWQQGLAYEEQRTAVAGATLDVSDTFDVHL
jgi:DNA-binding SARP family transcriptional activator/tetratricopeptide (TPR) repeat protein